MAAAAKGGARRKKDQEMAADLAKRGIYHGKRHYPTTQGINYPHLGDAGSAAHRRAQQGRRNHG